jgi:hypothetical protein
LTSAAFSLRASGPVDGRSNQVSTGPREASWDQYNAAVPQETETQTFRAVDTQGQRSDGSWPPDGGAEAYRGTSAYLYPGRPASEPPSYSEGPPYEGHRSRAELPTGTAATAPANTPFGDPYGNAPADEPRHPNGAGTRRGTRSPWPGHPGPMLPGESHRRPRDPRDDYRR